MSEWCSAPVLSQVSDADAPCEAAVGAGTVFADRYQAVALLGQGGMGEVWLGWDEVLERNVAIKVPRGAPDSPAAQHLRREATLAAQMDHPGVVAVHDIVRSPDSLAFVMAWVPGETLAAHLGKRGAPTGAVDVALIRHVEVACAAVAHAHSQGIVHRDLSPTNVLIGDDGTARVIDWGVATRVDAEPTRAGTRGFTAPEQAGGEPPTPAADVWSLGAVLHAIVFGAPPNDTEPRSGGHPALEAVIAKALHEDADQRYPDAAALGADLRRWLEGRPVEARGLTAAALARYAWRRWRGSIAAATAGLALAVAALLWGITAKEAQAARASQAEAEATSALAESVAQRAEDLWERGDVAGAVRMAEQALASTAHPTAVGVLAMAAAHPAAEPVERGAIGPCDQFFVDPRHPQRAACQTREHVQLYDGFEPTGRVPSTTGAFRFDGDVLRITLVDREFSYAIPSGTRLARVPTANRRVLASRSASGWEQSEDGGRWFGIPGGQPPPCDGFASSVELGRNGVAWVSCSDGVAFARDEDGMWREVVGLESAHALAVLDDGTAWAATSDGTLVPLESLRTPVPVGERVNDLVPVPGRAQFWVQTTSGALRLYDVDLDDWVGSLPATDAPIGVTEDGDVWTYDGVERILWRMGEGPVPGFRVAHGLAAVDWTPNGRVLAAGGGPEAHGLHVHTGQRTDWPAPRTGVARAAFEVAEHTVVIMETGGGALDRPDLQWDGSVRRAAPLEDGWLWSSYHRIHRVRVTDGWASSEVPDLPHGTGRYRDVDASSDGRTWAAAARDAVVVSVADTPPILYDAAAAEVVAVRADGTVVYAGGATIAVRPFDAETEHTFAVPSPVLDLDLTEGTASPPLLVSAHRDGYVRVWTIGGELVASLKAHRARAAAVAIAPDGHWIASAGWDGRVRIASLDLVRESLERTM